METEPKPRMQCVVSTHMQLQMLSIVCVKVITGEGKALIAIKAQDYQPSVPKKLIMSKVCNLITS